MNIFDNLTATGWKICFFYQVLPFSFDDTLMVLEFLSELGQGFIGYVFFIEGHSKVFNFPVVLQNVYWMS